MTFEERETVNAKQRAEITRKLEAGENLTTGELWIMGEQLNLDVVRDYPDCSDMYYRRLFFPWLEGKDPFGIPLTELQEEDFVGMVHAWTSHLQIEYAEGSLARASQKETDRELRTMEKEWKKAPGMLMEEKDEKVFDLLLWSKFRYVLVRRIFDLDISADYYPLYLNGKELRLDYESVIHILTRHFAHGMKPYNSTKDHFYGVFAYNRLHKDFESIFRAIDASGQYVNDQLTEITFRYLGEIYRIYASAIDSENDIYRIDTFFPVSKETILNELNTGFDETAVNNQLRIFTKKK